MAPLRSLERDYPVIDSTFIQFCASHGIFTVEDFLFQDTNALIASAENEVTSNTLKLAINQILSVIDAMHLNWSNGSELLASRFRNECVISESLESIGTFLHGGLRQGFLTELVGLSSSGKTQVCLSAAMSVASVTRAGVVFIDTGNSFSAHRVAKLVLRDSTAKIESKLKCQVQNSQDLVQLLIVDSVSSLITPVLGGSGPNGHAVMISLGCYLKKLAIEYNVSVLITNHMVSGEGGVSKPALGESWKNVAHVRIHLSRDRESNICKMSLLKHPSMALKVAPVKIFEDP